ncbi:two component transcriptional regulator, LuxR family [Bryocella elongata]|uniref:Two component transcriptional regulator, LuxR family n=1 Tax=Bryocella elongata TaxID=863522 RepID=A0A1H5VUK6_9BACT|nr:response regulator transcription factor [Bryocella elongata]SEF90541.1 two component transcriptional regulator, LuxR family [Bryocella elongata]
MTETKKIRILCVDDHPLVRDGIAFALQLQKDMELVGEATTGEEAVQEFKKLLPDITLMDLQMPGMNGITAIEAIRAHSPKAKIVVLTTYSGDVQASRAFRAGASGYLLKSMLRTELIGTIRDVHMGRKRIPPEIAASLAEHLSVDDLSQREIEVLRSVSSGNSNKIVADDLSITEDTVKGHMRNIMTKLGANDRTHAVLIAIKRGFLEG